MIDSHEYRLRLSGAGVKAGRFTDPEADLPPLRVASPPEFGGPGGIWSPEHMFVAAVSSCLMTTFRAIAEMASLEVVEYSDDASGRLARAEDGLYHMESVTVRPRVVIADPAKAEKTHRLLEKAERACLISRSLRAAVRMEPTVEVARHAAAG